MNVTGGTWIVMDNADPRTREKFPSVVMVAKTGSPTSHAQLLGLACHPEDAALWSISRDMLETLVAIQETLNTSKKVIDLEKIDELISEVFGKLANEAGEEI